MTIPRPLAVAAALIALAVAASACSDDPPELVGYERLEPVMVGDLSLPSIEPDGSETPFAITANDGELLVVYFGYTGCPDVCPTSLSDLQIALRELGDDADSVQLAMITIDPEVDTHEVLPQYVRTFVDNGVGLRSDDEAVLRPVAERFVADYGVEEVDGEKEVFHTASMYVVDDTGELVLTWPFGTAPSDLASDLKILQSQT